MAEPYIPPPPPYETSQQELDQKISRALEASLVISDPQPPRGSHADDDQWENFDEAAFEAAYEAAKRQRESQGGSSNTQPSAGSSAQPPRTEKWDRPTSLTVQPLRIHKKTPSNPKAKERPSWYTEANLSAGPALSGAPAPYSEPYGPPSEPPHHRVPPDHGEDRNQAPPPFQAVGLSLDSPPVVMAYHGNGSAPPSPLSSPRSPVDSHQHSRHIPSPKPDRTSLRSPQPYWSHPHQSLPPPSRRVPHRTSPRPATSFTPAMKTVSQPHMTFDHSVAYMQREDDIVASTTEPRTTAFYNSAVSPHLSASPSKPTSRAFQPHTRQSQYLSHPPAGGTHLFNKTTSLTHSVPLPLSYASHPEASPLTQPSASNGAQIHQPAGAHTRWATSEDQIGRDY